MPMSQVVRRSYDLFNGMLSIVNLLSSITNICAMTTRKKYFSKSAITINAAVAKQTFFSCLLTRHHPNFSPRTLAVMMEIMAYASLGAPIYAGWSYDDR
ncbi:MAG: hypothetical protein WBE61_06335 [Nitrososphaeraceae archaeon]